MTITPRGVAAGLFVVLVAGVCVRLGFWQLDRLEQRRERNVALERALNLPPLTLSGDTLDTLMGDPSPFLHRRVRVRGTYAPAGEVVLRGRSLNGRPGVHLVTPLEIAGSRHAVLVERGWVASPDARTIDPRPLGEPGERVVEGILLPLPHVDVGARPSRFVVDGEEVLTLQRLDLALMQGRSRLALLPAYIQQLPGPTPRTRPPHRVPLPALDEGPHLGYAVQWFSFAAIAVIGFAVFVLRGKR